MCTVRRATKLIEVDFDDLVGGRKDLFTDQEAGKASGSKGSDGEAGSLRSMARVSANDIEIFSKVRSCFMKVQRFR